MKKIFAILMAMIMMLSVAAMAATINVDGVVGKTYSAYQIFAIEKNEATGAEIFTIESTSPWFPTVQSVLGNTLVKRTTDAAETTYGVNGTVSEETVKDLAAKLKTAYEAMESKPAADDTKVAGEDGKAALTVANNGYFFVTSTLGALCMMDTANATAEVKEKNGDPTVDKEVENLEGTTADIGKELTYTATITVADANPTNYVYHDKMSESLTFSGEAKLSVTKNGAAFTDYTVKTSELGDDCTFHVVFAEESLAMNDVIVVTYKAVINEKALTISATNEAKLTYGEDGKTSTDTTVVVKTASIEIYKYAINKDNAEDKSQKLAGAQFVLKNGNGKFYKIENNVVSWVDEADATVVITEADDGKATFAGIADGTYELVEIAAPAGYNALTAPVPVTVTSNDEEVSITVPAEVGNQAGTELPSTGGIGTTIFYVVGGLLMAAAVILLVTNKKMSAAK